MVLGGLCVHTRTRPLPSGCAAPTFWSDRKVFEGVHDGLLGLLPPPGFVYRSASSPGREEASVTSSDPRREEPERADRLLPTPQSLVVRSCGNK